MPYVAEIKGLVVFILILGFDDHQNIAAKYFSKDLWIQQEVHHWLHFLNHSINF